MSSPHASGLSGQADESRESSAKKYIGDEIGDEVDLRSSGRAPAAAAAVSDPPDDIGHFMAIPWCRELLQPPSPSSSIRVVLPSVRRAGRPANLDSNTFHNRLDTLDNAFSTTLNTADTIRAYVLFYNDPAPPLSGPQPGPLLPITELKALMTLGAGLSGHPGVSHGGIVAAILDEVLGMLIPLNRVRAMQAGKSPKPQASPASSAISQAEEAAVASVHVKGGFVTGYLNTTYIRPVRTEATVLVTARFMRREGQRKFYVEGDIRDAEGSIRTKAEAVFICLRGKL